MAEQTYMAKATLMADLALLEMSNGLCDPLGTKHDMKIFVLSMTRYEITLRRP